LPERVKPSTPQYTQLRYPFELPPVVYNQDQVIGEGDGCDLGIVRTDGYALPREVSANFAESSGGLAGKGQTQ